AATVPRDREMLAVWLDDVWSQVDNWVRSHAADQSTPDMETQAGTGTDVAIHNRLGESRK
ncbi:MAG: hypothetical protein M3319_14725, partial [Actinomycetota bacterium]|nr:hypothetical protein [Actinomycetota bacterium]